MMTVLFYSLGFWLSLYWYAKVYDAPRHPLHITYPLDAFGVSLGALKTQVLEKASTEKASTKQRKYESAGMENASRPTENASTMQTFSQIKKVWYFTSFSVGAFSSGVGKWITDCFFLR